MSLKVAELTRLFGSTKAVDNLSFEITKPSVVGFLGPNGAGKTTTMRMITGFLEATSGSVSIDDQAVTSNTYGLRRKIGYLPESNPLYTELEVGEYLEFMADLSGLDATLSAERLEFVTQRCGLKEVLFEPISQLSKGFKQRVGLAQAIIHDPQILILDEPTSGLDPNQVIEIRNLISELAKEKYVILSTHILSEVRALCDRVLIINKGKLVLDATSDELQHNTTGRIVVRLKSEASPEKIKEEIVKSAQPHRISVIKENKNLKVELSLEDSESAREKLFDVCAGNGFKILELTGVGSDLEQLFRELTIGSDETQQ